MTGLSAISNARWLFLTQGYRIVLQLASMSVLARLLPPSDYGLMAMAWTATNLASLFRDLGTGSALIQKRDLNERTVATVFCMNVVFGSLLGVSLLASSAAIAGLFRQPALTPILSLLAITFPLGSLSVVHQALLERNSQFAVLARIEVVANTFGLAVAILAAILGAGVYSFVLQAFVITLLFVIQSWLALRWRLRLEWDARELRQVLAFCGHLSVSNIVNYVARNADSMIIGRVLGASALGTYSMAYRLMLFPIQSLSFVASRALFPVMSRLQDRPDQVAALYTRAVASVASVSLPLMAGLWVLREPGVRVLFGSQWGYVADVIAWLAPVGALQSIVSTTGALYMAKGRTDLLMKLGVLGAILAIAAFVLGVSDGITTLAQLYLVANIIAFIPYTAAASRVAKMPYLVFLRAMLPPISCVLAMLPVAWLCSLATASWGDLASCVVTSIVGSVTYVVCYLVFFNDRAIKLVESFLGSALKTRLSAGWRQLLGATIARTTGGAKPIWLFIDLSRDFGGHEVMMLRWIEELRRSSHVVPILVCHENTRLSRRASGLCEMRHPGKRESSESKIGRLLSFLPLLTLLYRTKSALQPQVVVVAEGCILSQRHGLYAASLLRMFTVLYVPIVTPFLHMGLSEGKALERRVQRFYGRLPNAWVTITADQAKELKRWTKATQPIFTLPNTVQSHIDERSIQVLGRLPSKAGCDRMRVLVLGRLDPHQKGLDLLLDYAQRTPSLAKNFLVRLVGEGPYAEVVAAARRRDATLASFVTVEPWANDTTEVLSAHDALFITSRYEGVPLVMLEAMAMGIPVVASDLDGTRAYLTDECLFPVGRIDKGFERLSALRESEELRLSVALRNAEVFRRRASSGVFASAVEVLTLRFGDLVRSKSRASPVPPAPVEQPSARS